jgi:hypothetical protein
LTIPSSVLVNRSIDLLDVPGEYIASPSVDPSISSILMLRRPCCFQFPEESDNGKLAMNHSNKGGTLSAESDKGTHGDQREHFSIRHVADTERRSSRVFSIVQ